MVSVSDCVWFCGSGGRLDLVCNGGARRGPGGRHPGRFWGVRGNQEPSPEPWQTYRLPQGNKAKKACSPWDLKIFVVGVGLLLFFCCRCGWSWTVAFSKLYWQHFCSCFLCLILTETHSVDPRTKKSFEMHHFWVVCMHVDVHRRWRERLLAYMFLRKYFKWWHHSDCELFHGCTGRVITVTLTFLHWMRMKH